MATAVTISRAAERAGVGVETIRFYERRGLIRQPARPRSGGYRFYDDEIVERIRFIRLAQELGFSLREITDLLSLRTDPAADCADVRAQARIKRQEIDRKIAQLQHIRDALDELIASCPGGGALVSCTIIDALTPRPGRKTNRSAPASLQPRGQSRNRTGMEKGRKVKTATLKLDGMHCDGCAQTIKALITTVPGVRAADVSFKDSQAHILYEPRTITEDQLVALIEKGGFGVSGRQ